MDPAAQKPGVVRCPRCYPPAPLSADVVLKRDESEEVIASPRIEVTKDAETKMVAMPRVPEKRFLGSPGDILLLRLAALKGRPCV